jgi:hypothetical protein
MRWRRSQHGACPIGPVAAATAGELRAGPESRTDRRNNAYTEPVTNIVNLRSR